MALYHSAKGPVDYTIVGSPTIVNGVASGFGNGNYLVVPSIALDNFEFVIKFTTPGTLSSQYLFSANTNGLYIRISTYTSTDIRVRITYGNSGIWGNFTLQPSTSYKIKVTYDGSTLSLYNYNNGNWEYNSSTICDAITTAKVNRFGVLNTASNPFLGYIDLNQTYIKVNGQPWFGVCPVEVKKHQLKGPVGYTVVGSPTIVDGIASGFSSRDYLTISKPTLNTNDFEFKTCFTPGNSANQRIITTMSGSTTRSGFVIDFASRLNACFYNATEVLVISSNTSLVANTKYYAIMYRQGTTIGLKLSTDNQTWENVTQTILATDSIVLSDNLGIGRSSQSTFTGSINLNETYIKVNGKLWFYQPADTKYIVKDGKLVWADPRIALSGPVDYTVVGNPTIIDGVASGFSSSDYLGFSSDLNDMASANSWEVVIRFTHKTVSAFRAFLGNTGSNFSSFGVNTANKLRLGLFDDRTTVADILSTTVLQDSQSYYAKFIYDSTEGYKMYLRTDETTYTLENYTPNTAKFKSQGTWKMGFVYSNPFPGSIDLNETYIKVNDQLWFYGKNYATQNIAPVPAGYTFGNTTTPSIGYVDMRTQQFTAAPQGATIERDE